MKAAVSIWGDSNKPKLEAETMQDYHIQMRSYLSHSNSSASSEQKVSTQNIPSKQMGRVNGIGNTFSSNSNDDNNNNNTNSNDNDNKDRNNASTEFLSSYNRKATLRFNKIRWKDKQKHLTTTSPYIDRLQTLNLIVDEIMTLSYGLCFPVIK
ncbi:unnamed protein product [Schistosoma curassoni]|uniref:Ras-GEF domain-containing protein n=1 Tax=Schistosoma curassoni TaxID=6186 RepID=A0A183KEN7_9TREM|nr:unnamed protein product [Schistosoma curassoni]